MDYDIGIVKRRRIIPPDDLYFAVPSVSNWWLSGAAVDLKFTTGQYYDGADGAAVTTLLSCSRASIGYAQTVAGTLTQFAANQLRITDRGLLVEDARTNLILNSQVFNSWSADNTTATADQATAPDGTVTMDKIDDGTSNSRHIVYESNQFTSTFSAGDTVTVSVYVEDVDRRYVQLVLLAVTNPGALYAFFDLQTGTVGDNGVFTAGTGTSFTGATIEALANGIYRISITGILNSTTTSALTELALSDRSTNTGSFNNESPSYTGTNKSIYAWGGQLEVGAFASSYIPTTTAAATRAADSVTVAGTLDSVLAATNASIITDVKLAAIETVAIIGKTSNPILMNANVSFPTFVLSDGSGFASLNGQTWTGGVKVGFAYSGFVGSLAGGGGAISASNNSPNNYGYSGNKIGGPATGLTVPFGYFSRLTAWDTRLADATLQGFTNP